MSARLGERARRLEVTLVTLVLPPLVWAGHFLFSYVVAAVHCAKAGDTAVLGAVRPAIAGATGLALIVIAACGVVAYWQTRGGSDPPPHQESTLEDRFRFLATATLLLAGLSAVAVVFTATPTLFLGDCR